MLLGVWQFFYLGRVYSKEIREGEVPGIGGAAAFVLGRFLRRA